MNNEEEEELSMVGATDYVNSKREGRHIVRISINSEKGVVKKEDGHLQNSPGDTDDEVFINYYISNGKELWKVQSDHLWKTENDVIPTAVEQIFCGGKFTGVKRYLPATVKSNHLNPYFYLTANKSSTDSEVRRASTGNMADKVLGIPNGNTEILKGHVNPAYTDLDDDLDKNDKYGSFNDKQRNPPTAQILPNTHKTDDGDCTVVSLTDERVPGEVIEDIRTSEVVPEATEYIPPQLNSSYSNEEFTIPKFRPESDEDTKWLSWMETQFKQIAGDDGEISLEEFKHALGVRKSFFAERFFSLFDQDKSGSIELQELMDGLRMLTKGTPTQKLKFLFEVYDADGSGSIDRDELKTVLKSCMEESSLSLSDENLDALTDVLFDSADEDDSGSITFDELKAELQKYPGVLENLTISAAQWLKPPTKQKKKKSRYLTWTYIRNNLKKVVFLLVYLLVNLGLGAYAAYNYRSSNGFTIAARICGINLNFNCMFILVLMLRKTFTYLLMTPLAKILPLEQNILFHKMVGYMIVLYTAVHTFGHIGNAVLLSQSSDNLEVWEILFTTKAGVGYVSSSAYITGWLLLLVLMVMFVCSMEFVRRGGHFQVFYWTHMLYVVFWILVILHGPVFWRWFIAPGVIFLVEKISRSKFIKQARFGKNYIEYVNLLPSGVTHLVISRPEHFRFKAGDYIFIQIPVIARHEWHPFTISSAPEMKGRIWLHVRSAGHWTNKLYKYFEELDPGEQYDKVFEYPLPVDTKQCSEMGSIVLTSISHIDQDKMKRPRSRRYMKEDPSTTRKKQKSKKVHVQVYIDGPYGTATREIFHTEHAVLVGTGIGITPMASILQSVMFLFKDSKRTCPHCHRDFYGDPSETTMKLRKIDFVWVNRDQKAFEWFISMLTQLEVEQAEIESEKGVRIMDMHMFMTTAQKKTDMKGIGLQIALDLMHKKENKDLITGLKTKTQPGRPDWHKLFTEIAKEKRGKVKVFFCGAPALGKIIKHECERMSFAFSKENF